MIDWQEVAIDGETHVSRIAEVYEELGFEVRLEEVEPDEIAQCTKCFQEKGEKIYRVYTRRKRERAS
jgi:multimeric flavodoxin WrbA